MLDPPELPLEEGEEAGAAAGVLEELLEPDEAAAVEELLVLPDDASPFLVLL